MTSNYLDELVPFIFTLPPLRNKEMCFCIRVSLTGVQALGDCGRFDQVPSAQVTGDEMVKVSHQMLPSCSSHVWSVFRDS